MTSATCTDCRQQFLVAALLGQPYRCPRCGGDRIHLDTAPEITIGEFPTEGEEGPEP